MSHYKPYPAYKDSGVEWLGQVPEGWKVSAVKWEFESRLGKMLQPKPNEPTDFLVPYHKAVSVQWEKIALEAPESMWATVSDVETYQVRKGDLLICEGGDVGRAAIFQGDDTEPLIIQNSVHRVRSRNGNLSEGLLRIMQVVRAAGWFDVLCSKATIVHFTGEKLGSLAYPVAPIAEQRVIAAYIDRETVRIDGLVSRKTRFIELLREKRQALITHAVTKGLNPDAPMKNSGVEWLGEVPEHWAVCKLSFRYSVELGKMLDEKRITGESLVPYLRNQDVQWNSINTEGLPEMDIHLGEIERYTIKRGDLLVCEGGDVGRAAIWRGSNLQIGFQKALHRLRARSNKLDTAEFFYFSLLAAK